MVLLTLGMFFFVPVIKGWKAQVSQKVPNCASQLSRWDFKSDFSHIHPDKLQCELFSAKPKLQDQSASYISASLSTMAAAPLMLQ